MKLIFRIYLSKRKTHDTKTQSHKEFFDWESNVKEDFENRVYDEKTDKSYKSKKNQGTFKFGWNGIELPENYKEVKTTPSIVRTNKSNLETKEKEIFSDFKKKKKCNTMFTESSDFVISSIPTAQGTARD